MNGEITSLKHLRNNGADGCFGSLAALWTDSSLMSDRGPFWRPARIGFNLAIDSDNDDRAHLVARLQATDDQSLANAIADNIGKLAGETYRAAISSKSFSKLRSSGHTSNEIGRVTILVALAAAGGT